MDFMIEYRIKPEQKEKAENVRDRFFSVLQNMNDSGFRYRSLCKADGLSFVHLGWFENPDALARFQGIPEFKEFAAGLKEIAETGPDATELTEINTSEI